MKEDSSEHYTTSEEEVSVEEEPEWKQPRDAKNDKEIGPIRKGRGFLPEAHERVKKYNIQAARHNKQEMTDWNLKTDEEKNQILGI